jgi:hypothetical protein
MLNFLLNRNLARHLEISKQVCALVLAHVTYIANVLISVHTVSIMASPQFDPLSELPGYTWPWYGATSEQEK